MDKIYDQFKENRDKDKFVTERLVVNKLKKYKPVFTSIEYNQHILRDDNVHRDTLLRVNFDLGKIFYYDLNLEYIMKVLEKKAEKQLRDSKQRNLDLINLNDLLDELGEI